MNQPLHSKRGASSAERWLNCPGSVELIAKLELPESEGEDYQRAGTSAHAALCQCLREGLDAWELVGTVHEGVAVLPEWVAPMQVYLDTCRSLITPHGTTLIETRISSDDHPDFYGTVDFAHVADSLLNVVDYKHGEGIKVDAEANPQVMYYAYGILQRYPEVRRVVMRIVQPRHPLAAADPVSRWECSAEDLHTWAQEKLLPGMRTKSDELMPGEHCRFCPAKLVCPILVGMFEAACTADAGRVVELTNTQIGANFNCIAGVKQYIKALETVAFDRMMLGQDVPGTKLVEKKADRVWKEKAAGIFQARFGPEAMTKPELLSPAQMEKIGAEAKELVKQWAYKPQTGLTLAPVSDRRPAVKVQSPSEVFQEAVQ